MMMARKAGMPAPKVLSFGEHYSAQSHKNMYSTTGDFIGKVEKPMYSILMTRLPGIDLFDNTDDLEVEVEGPWLSELKECITAMRKWRSPYGESICSAIGTEIHSVRVPWHAMGPFNNEHELDEYLMAAASENCLGSKEAYDNEVAKANELRQHSHQVMFTHGDFKAHNILVADDGHLSGFLDWESGGWCPEYWEFTTAMATAPTSWWGQTAAWLGGDAYTKELAYEKSLASLTADSYSFW